MRINYEVIFDTALDKPTFYSESFKIGISNKQIYFSCDTADVYGKANIADGKFHHIVVQREVETNVNSIITIYVDGKVENVSRIADADLFFVGNTAKSVYMLGNFYRIGCPFLQNSTAAKFNGILRDFALYEAVLDSLEIRQFYYESISPVQEFGNALSTKTHSSSGDTSNNGAIIGGALGGAILLGLHSYLCSNT